MTPEAKLSEFRLSNYGQLGFIATIEASLNHTELLYSIITPAKGVTCDDCGQPPILLLHIRDHKSQNFITQFCEGHASAYFIGLLKSRI